MTLRSEFDKFTNRVRQLLADFGISRSQMVAGMLGTMVGAALALPIAWISGYVAWILCWVTMPAYVLFFLMSVLTRTDVISDAQNPWATGALWIIAVSLVGGVYALAGRMYFDQHRRPSA